MYPLVKSTLSLSSLFRAMRRKLYLARLSRIPGVSVHKSLKIYGRPLVFVAAGGRIEIAENVTLNSDPLRYHLHMNSPVKLLADRADSRISIGANTRLNGACIHAWQRVQVGEGCLIAAGVQICDANGHQLSFPDVEQRISTRDDPQAVVIEDHVWIGYNALILPGVRVGRGSVVAAGSIVTRDVPPNCLVGGIPAKVLRRFDSGEGWPSQDGSAEETAD
jgi:acetyltransferase-like isoleucine patch superfamily enzyme